jgi:hypothetical protein
LPTITEVDDAETLDTAALPPTAAEISAPALFSKFLADGVGSYIGTYCAVMSTYAFWTSLPHSDTDGHGHLIAMTDSKTVKQRFKGGKVRGTPMMQTHSLFIDALEA